MPPISQFTRTYSKYLDDMTFEARLFVDGNLVSCVSVNMFIAIHAHQALALHRLREMALGRM